MSDMNPRVTLWLKCVGLQPADIDRTTHDEVRRITLACETGEVLTMPWTVFCIEWLQARWRQWARELGHTTHHDAAMVGHTAEEFDLWLTRHVNHCCASSTTLSPSAPSDATNAPASP